MGSAPKTAEWLRLFMVPGMAHHRGGDGPNTFDALTALEGWVESRQAPDKIIARPDSSSSLSGRNFTAMNDLRLV
jgi:feruloyl esterase